MANYRKAQSWNRANCENSLWYVQTDTDKTNLSTNETISSGDRCYVIETQKEYMMGFDNSWYEMPVTSL